MREYLAKLFDISVLHYNSAVRSSLDIDEAGLELIDISEHQDIEIEETDYESINANFLFDDF